jgi:hypothetical protein
MRKLCLTFDVEDFINSNEIISVQIILELLAKHDLTALFFISGHSAEKLGEYPNIVTLLNDHEIGFHSSSHSVRPTIPEYTDVDSYEKAYKISLERESSHVNPLTGIPEGKGGILVLHDLFKSKKICSFRAPGMSWTPPNLEALVNMGIKFDFSSNISRSKPIQYKGITFYPYTFMQSWDGGFHNYKCLVSSFLKRQLSILNLHPTLFVNQHEWDSIYYRGNPSALTKIQPRTDKDSSALFKNFELFLKRINFLQQTNLIEVVSKPVESRLNLSISRDQVERVYQWSIRWPVNRFQYHPKFLRHHFYFFFESAIRDMN